MSVHHFCFGEIEGPPCISHMIIDAILQSALSLISAVNSESQLNVKQSCVHYYKKVSQAKRLIIRHLGSMRHI